MIGNKPNLPSRKEVNAIATILEQQAKAHRLEALRRELANQAVLSALNKKPFTISEDSIPENIRAKEQPCDIPKIVAKLANKALREHDIAVQVAEIKDDNISDNELPSNNQIALISRFTKPKK